MEQQKVGLFIAQERKRKSMTQQELADRLHVTNKAVSKWECGKSLPDMATLEPLAAALDVSLEELLSGRRLPAPLPGEKKPHSSAPDLRIALKGMKWVEQRQKKLWTGALLLWAGCLAVVAQMIESIRNEYFGFIGTELINSLSLEDWRQLWEANGGEYWRTVFPGVSYLQWEGQTAWRLSSLWGYFMCKPWMLVLFLAAVAAIVVGVVLRRQTRAEKFDFSVDNS